MPKTSEDQKKKKKYQNIDERTTNDFLFYSSLFRHRTKNYFLNNCVANINFLILIILF